MILVSVIIPCFNVEDYISECIESVLSQTHSELEIICVDNNSSDKTFQILQNYQIKYPDKIIILSELKKGAPAARNKGLLVSKGGWVQFLDADDVLLPSKIEHQMKIVSANRNIGFISGAFFSQPFNGEKKKISLELKDPFKAVFVTNLGITSANLFNAKNIKNINGWNESLTSSQESDLMFRLLKDSIEVTGDDLPLTIVRERQSGQISQSDPKRKWLQYITLRLDILNYLKISRPVYFSEEKEFYYQNLFSQIRTFSKYDFDKASAILKSNFEKDFVPKSGGGFSFYSKLFRMFGFKGAEKIRTVLGKLKL